MSKFLSSSCDARDRDPEQTFHQIISKSVSKLDDYFESNPEFSYLINRKRPQVKRLQSKWNKKASVFYTNSLLKKKQRKQSLENSSKLLIQLNKESEKIWVKNFWKRFRTVENAYKYSKSFREMAKRIAPKLDAPTTMGVTERCK